MSQNEDKCEQFKPSITIIITKLIHKFEVEYEMGIFIRVLRL